MLRDPSLSAYHGALYAAGTPEMEIDFQEPAALERGRGVGVRGSAFDPRLAHP